MFATPKTSIHIQEAYLNKYKKKRCFTNLLQSAVGKYRRFFLHFTHAMNALNSSQMNAN